MSHDCKIVQDRYPTCTCGSGVWPCWGKEENEARAKQREDDQRIARAVVDEMERRSRRR